MPYTTSICTRGIGAVHLLGAWVSRLLVTALVVAYTPIISRTLAMPSLLSGSSIWLGLGLGVLCDLEDYMHFVRQIVSRLVPDGQGSLRWCHTKPHPAARCCNVLATGCLTSARKPHLRMALCTGWGQKRSRTSSACSDGATAGVVEFRITRSLGARLNTASGTPLHCPAHNT